MYIDRVAILIKKASLEFDKVANPIFAEYNLTAAQYRILKFLCLSESRTAQVVDLERYYSMTHPTALGILEQLEKKEFVKRVENPNDARGKLVALTAKTDSMQDELIALGDAVEEKLTQGLTTEETAQLVKLLNKLLGEDC